MAEIVSGLASPIVQLGEWLWIPVKRGLSYMIHYKKNIQSLKLQVGNLEAMKNGYQEIVRAVQTNGEDVKPEIQIWLQDANKAIADATQLNNEAEEAAKNCITGNLRWRYSLGKKVMKKKVALNKLQEEGKFESISVPVMRPIEIESTMSTNGFQAFAATRQAMDQVMKALKDDKVTVIGVYGMGGVGKTTMVKNVGVQACKDGLFDHVIMAVFTQNPNLMKIQGQLSDMLGLKLQEETELGRACRLRNRILRAKRTLIILDDIWNTLLDLISIGIPNHTELQGCNSKVLLTTRRLNVCHAMESHVKIPLNVLSEGDSWNLFVKKAGRSFESPAFNNIARKVARECAGLPIALIAVARALGDKDIDEWKEAARQLEMSRPANLEDEGDVLRCIKLSYDYLKGEDAKSCFLLCSLFPEDGKIPIQDLFNYWFGNGLFREGKTLEEARARAHSVIKYLKASSLLLDGERKEYVRMHDVIRDMAISIAYSEQGHEFLVKAGWELEDWPNDVNEGCSAISLKSNCICKLPEELVCPRLRILVIDDNLKLKKISEAFFRSLNALRVLDLSSTCISSLPSSLNLLTNLQTLHLDSCWSLKDISVLRELTKLEILSLKDSRFEELPKEIGNLASLRLLDFAGNTMIQRVPSNVISRLSRLEELYMQGSFGNFGSRIEGAGEETNVGFDELTCLSYLSNLTVQIHSAECIPENVGFHPNWEKFYILIKSQTIPLHKVEYYDFSTSYGSRILALDTTINNLPSWFNSAVTERAKKIVYKECRGLINIIEEYAIERLHELMSLHVESCHQMRSLMNYTATNLVPNKLVFRNLEELCVSNMNELKELCVGDLPDGSLGNLTLLEVKKCHAFANALLQSNLLEKLESLEVLIVDGMKSLEYVFQSDGLKPEQTVMGKCREMKLEDLPALRNIWNGPAQHATFHNLKILTVAWCMKLKNIFTADMSRCLSQLEELWLSECDCLETIIGPSEGTLNSKIILPQLNYLSLQRLPRFKSFYSGASTDVECPSMEHLYVHYCPEYLISTSDFNSRKEVQVNADQQVLFGPRKIKASYSMTRETPTLIDDGYAWKNCGQDEIPGSDHPRIYYRCIHKFNNDCQATKEVQKFRDDPPMYETTYFGIHTCRAHPNYI
ncbi:hypothetical protein ACFX2J_019692 [Malus domestica]